MQIDEKDLRALLEREWRNGSSSAGNSFPVDDQSDSKIWLLILSCLPICLLVGTIIAALLLVSGG